VRSHILTIMIHGNEFTGSIITAATDSRAHALGGVNTVIGTEVGDRPRRLTN